MDRTERLRLDPEQIERAIDQIPGVQTSQVTVGPNDDIQEIHLLGATSRSPKQVVRDVESLLLLQFRLRCDYRKISLVQIDEGKLGTDSILRGRPRLAGVDIVRTPDGNHVTVRIEARDSVYSSTAEMGSDENGYDSVAVATLGAVRYLLDKSVSLSIDEVKIIELGKRNVAVACVTALMQGAVQTYLGASFAHDNPYHAVVRATLDALNRKLGAPANG